MPIMSLITKNQKLLKLDDEKIQTTAKLLKHPFINDWLEYLRLQSELQSKKTPIDVNALTNIKNKLGFSAPPFYKLLNKLSYDFILNIGAAIYNHFYYDFNSLDAEPKLNGEQFKNKIRDYFCDITGLKQEAFEETPEVIESEKNSDKYKPQF